MVIFDFIPRDISQDEDANPLKTTVMERDLRLTGNLRGQSSNAVAPKGFEVNNPWKVRFIGSGAGL